METIEMNEKTIETLDLFKQISVIPRCSGNEKHMAAWLEEWARASGLDVRTDLLGNVVIRVPATSGYESAEGIVIQGHMDMVCEKAPGSGHDFSRDPISIRHDDDWLTADRTTLGADNGIGIALCLALAKDDTIAHPRLELLFTVEEETGLRGATSLQQGFIEGRFLINIDSEDEGVFTVGSAGGRILQIEYPISTEPVPGSFKTCTLRTSGLRGGHSGVDIHKRRGNANKILTDALTALCNAFDIRLVSIKGGTLSNAIPRDAEAVIACNPARFSELQALISDFERNLRNKYADSDPEVSIGLSEADPGPAPSAALLRKDTDNVIRLLAALPDGVLEMSPDIEGLVETSNNLARIELADSTLTVLNFPRSSVMAALDGVATRIGSEAARVGAVVKKSGDFPPWEPDMHSPLLKQCREVYRQLFNKEPEVSVIHAGLECGVIGSKIPGLDMISIGPTIENPHSPDERLHIPSIAKVWKFLVAFLESSQ
jgi:dipeptidase D